jgi:Tetratricopeptide repeat
MSALQLLLARAIFRRRLSSASRSRCGAFSSAGSTNRTHRAPSSFAGMGDTNLRHVTIGNAAPASRAVHVSQALPLTLQSLPKASEASVQRVVDLNCQAVRLHAAQQPQEAAAVLGLARSIVDAEGAKVVMATVLNNLGAVLVAGNRPYQAEPLLRTALDIRRIYLGDEHEDTFAVETNLACMFRRRGELAAGKELLEALLEKQVHTLGPLNENTGATQRLLAAIESEQTLAARRRRSTQQPASLAGEASSSSFDVADLWAATLSKRRPRRRNAPAHAVRSSPTA